MGRIIKLHVPEVDEILTNAMEHKLDTVLVLGIKDGQPCLFHSSLEDTMSMQGMIFEMMLLLREPVDD